MVAHSRLVLRHGVTDIFKALEPHRIPTFVLSGGIQEIIEVSLRHALSHHD